MAFSFSQLNQLVSDTVTGLDYEFVGCDWQNQGKHSVIRVFIDKQGGLTLDDCGVVSRQLGAVLDVEEAITGRYNLEVSSPGIERPLFTLEHYERFIGHKVDVRLRSPLDGQQHFKGMIEGISKEPEAVNLLYKDNTVILPFSRIKKAHLIVDF